MTPRDSGTQRDTGAPPPRDSGPSPCTTAAECDDGIACTLDECVVGNVCRYTPLDARCNTAAGERCLVGHGCRAGMPTDCETDEDCQDGSYCNGAEQCIVGRCYMGTARDCNDGNACTMDVCDDAMGRCRYELVCDAGTGRFDAGPGCDPFDPDVHYTGTFELLPGRACDAGLGSGYTISTVSFSRSGGVLTVTADRSLPGRRALCPHAGRCTMRRRRDLRAHAWLRDTERLQLRRRVRRRHRMHAGYLPCRPHLQPRAARRALRHGRRRTMQPDERVLPLDAVHDRRRLPGRQPLQRSRVLHGGVRLHARRGAVRLRRRQRLHHRSL